MIQVGFPPRTGESPLHPRLSMLTRSDITTVFRAATRWRTAVPLLALLALIPAWGSDPSTPMVLVLGLFLAGAVVVAVHHAEVIAERVGEPYGSLILAVAVTVIEVGLIVTLMVAGGGETETLARDTVFAAVMITCNGIIGVSILAAALRNRLAVFNSEGSATAFATVITLATLSLVLPTFTTSASGPEFSASQLAFAAVASLALYALFLVVQTVRHRSHFLTGDEAEPLDLHEGHPTRSDAVRSFVLLLLSLIAVVGLAKTSSAAIEEGVEAVGAPHSAVGVVIALLVLMPESLAATRNARRGRVQVSFNLGYGSAMASIGLTIPVIAVASIWLEGPLVLGLGSTQIVLLVLTALVSSLTLLPGRATLQEGGVHLILLAAFLFLAFNP